MENLQTLGQSELVYMLALHTEEYTRMFSEGRVHTDQFDQCKLLIKAIQKEIEMRRTSTDISSTNANIILPNES